MTAIKNILLVTFDQWRWECLSALGHPILQTPKLDAFCRDAVLFKNHWSVTCPCGPGRSALLTGTYLHKNRALRNGTPLDRRFTNIALETRKLNYDPALFGYTDISPDPRGAPHRDPIFNSYEGVLPGMTRICRLDEDFGTWFTDLEAKGYIIPAQPWDIFRPAKPVAGKGYSYAPASFKAEDSNAAFLTNSAIDYVSARRGQKWFAHITYISPHPPWIVSEPYHARYDAADVPMPVRAPSAEEEGALHPWLKYRIAYGGQPTKPGSGLVMGRDYDPATMPEAELRQLRATYYGMINEVEDNFDRLLDHLKATGEYDETLIVLTSDHGEQFGDHWLFGKTGFFDESYHIPLIIRDPRPAADSARGRQVDAFTESVDVMPTILDVLGAPIPRQVDGYPLTSFLTGGTPDGWRMEAHIEYDIGDPSLGTAEAALSLRSDECGLAVIRSAEYKYVHFAALPPLLFDLRNDPDERIDRSKDPAYREIMLEMAQRLLSWRMNTEERELTYCHIADGVNEYRDDRYDFLR
ncbi:alkaline phosphatase family protein [Rhodospirillaceae bacterium KN72]|uniref:Alkaline phosphatase family protein n=1 Tax=Pacificispira spongiicola TaxID=2729598 RepID=A0A7Y0DZY9_9PROT|nr:alkaline phosphatase family protein [Pacificispira spongiicola]NMM44583.1 alkaline phosphatase family protein [Pacificispira spongiicola]